MPFEYGKDYTSSQLPRELVDVGSGEVRYFEGTPYRVLNTGTGGRRLERPSFTEVGVNPQDRVQTPEDILGMAQKLQQQQLDLRKTANAPIAQSMKAGIPTLKNRYKQILDDLSFREGEQLATVTTNTAQEYGKRGIPLSSSVYSESLQKNLQPVNRFYSGERSNVGITEQENLDEINNAIAMLEAGNPSESIPQGLNLFSTVQNLIEGQKTRSQQQSQFQQQLEQAMKIAQMNVPKEKSESPYMTLGEGESIFDLSTLQNIFKNPKTKVAGGSGVDEWEYA